MVKINIYYVNEVYYVNENITLMKLELLMKEKNWSIYKLAKESDIPYSSLNNLFQRNTEPTLPTLRKICTGLGISLADFFSDEILYAIPEYSIDERKLISLYQSLKTSDKKLLMTYSMALNKEIPWIIKSP